VREQRSDTILRGLDSDLSWVAVQVRYRHEFVAVRHLSDIGYASFAPSYRSELHWSDRTKKVDVPLFSGYVFCQLSRAPLKPIFSSPAVIKIVGSRNNPLTVPLCEIEALQALMRSHYRVEPCPYLEAGSRVRIIDGPMIGVEGIVTLNKDKHRVVISVEIMRRSVAVEITNSMVSKIDRAA